MVKSETITHPSDSHPGALCLENARSYGCVPIVSRHAEVTATAATPPGIGVATCRRPIDLIAGDLDVVACGVVLIPHVQTDV